MNVLVPLQIADTQRNEAFVAMRRILSANPPASPTLILDNARALARRIRENETLDTLNDQVDLLERLIEMAADRAFGLNGSIRAQILEVLQYLTLREHSVETFMLSTESLDGTSVLDLLASNFSQLITTYSEFSEYQRKRRSVGELGGRSDSLADQHTLQRLWHENYEKHFIDDESQEIPSGFRVL